LPKGNYRILQHLDYHKVIIEDIREINPLNRRFFLKYEQDVVFQSGQFVIIDFIHLDHQFSTRSYSIADFTRGSVLELCVVLKKDGKGSPLLFENKPGDSLVASMPQGRFVLPEGPIEKPLCFICTGTGVAPFRAMIKDLLMHRGFTLPVHLFFGCRTQADILYREEFESLAREYPNFNYTPVLSRETWDGATGYVHPYYLKEFGHKPDALFYLCGWTVMLKETRDRLKELGYTRSDIKVEFYD
jgi:NAD(P)H-flavin reductase